MKDWIIARLKEKSTWLGIIGLLTAAGVAVNSDLTDAIVAFGTAIGGLVSAILVAIDTSSK